MQSVKDEPKQTPESKKINAPKVILGLKQVAVNDKSKICNVYPPDLDFEDGLGDGSATKRSIVSQGRLENIREVKEADFEYSGIPMGEESIPGKVDGKVSHGVGQKDEVDFLGNDTSKEEIILTRKTDTPEFDPQQTQKILPGKSNHIPRKTLLPKPEITPRVPSDPSYFVKEPAYFRKFHNSSNPNPSTPPKPPNQNPPHKPPKSTSKPLSSKKKLLPIPYKKPTNSPKNPQIPQKTHKMTQNRYQKPQKTANY
jgi:hypothetical protein